MRIPYGFTLTSSGTLEINRSEANVVRMIFDFYMAGASLGKVVDMLHGFTVSVALDDFGFELGGILFWHSLIFLIMMRSL